MEHMVENIHEQHGQARKSVSDYAAYVDVHADDPRKSSVMGNVFSEAPATSMSSSSNPSSPSSPPAVEEKKKKEDTSTAVAAQTKLGPKSLQSEISTEYKSLKMLVETQVQDLSRSIAALREFSDALPGALDSMLLTLSGVGPSQ